MLSVEMEFIDKKFVILVALKVIKPLFKRAATTQFTVYLSGIKPHEKNYSPHHNGLLFPWLSISTGQYVPAERVVEYGLE